MLVAEVLVTDFAVFGFAMLLASFHTDGRTAWQGGWGRSAYHNSRECRSRGVGVAGIVHIMLIDGGRILYCAVKLFGSLPYVKRIPGYAFNRSFGSI